MSSSQTSTLEDLTWLVALPNEPLQAALTYHRHGGHTLPTLAVKSPRACRANSTSYRTKAKRLELRPTLPGKSETTRRKGTVMGVSLSPFVPSSLVVVTQTAFTSKEVAP